MGYPCYLQSSSSIAQIGRGVRVTDDAVDLVLIGQRLVQHHQIAGQFSRGQMELYLRWLEANETQPGEQPQRLDFQLFRCYSSSSANLAFEIISCCTLGGTTS